jgi:hypothetical protein
MRVGWTPTTQSTQEALWAPPCAAELDVAELQRSLSRHASAFVGTGALPPSQDQEGDEQQKQARQPLLWGGPGGDEEVCGDAAGR